MHSSNSISHTAIDPDGDVNKSGEFKAETSQTYPKEDKTTILKYTDGSELHVGHDGSLTCVRPKCAS